MYLLAATEALAALGLVTPLRLGWRHHLTPVYRLVGVEVLLVGGVLLREKYFRRVAYGVFALTLLDILVLKLDPALGMGRTLLVGTGAGLWLLNAVLLRTVWREACQSEDEASSELPAAPYAFAVAGTLLLAILIWIEAPLKLYGVYYALVALLWLAVGWFKGYRDALALAPMLGLLASATVVWALVALPGAPGTVPARWLGATASALLLGLGPLLTRKAAHAAIPDAWKPAIRRCFACYGIAVTWVLLYQELPGNLVATGFALFALGLMAGAVLGKIRGLAPGALLTLAAALLMLLTRSAETHLAFWHLTYRGWSVLSVAGAAFSMEALVRSFRGRTLLTEGVWEFSRRFTSLAGFALLIFATNTELLPQWRATGLAALAVVHLGFGLWREYKDRAWQALLLFGGALLVLVVAPAPHTPGPWHITLHGWSLLGVGAMAFLFEWLIRRPGSEALFPRALRVGMTLFVTLSGLALGCFVLYAEMKAAWIAVGFGLSALLWLLLGLLWSHREKAYASFALLGLALFTLLTKPATMALGLGQITVWSWTLLGVGGCAFAMEFVTRREVASRLLGPETLQKGATLYTSLTGLSLGLLALFKEAPTHWLAVSLAGLALLHFALGILWTHKDRAYEAMALLVLALVVLGVQPATTLTAWAHVTTRGWTLIGVGTAAFLLQAMVRIPASTRVLDDSERQGALWLYSLAGTGLALVVIWSEAPDAWIAPLMTGLSVLLLVLGLLLGFKEQVAGSVVTSLAGVWAVASLGSTFHGEWLHVSLRAWNLGSLALLSLGQEALLRAWKGAWKWSEGAWRWLTGGHSLKAAVFLGLLAWLEFKPVLVPGGLMLLGCVWMVWARKRPSVLHAYEAFAFGLGSFLAMGSSFLVNGWPLKGEWFGLPERLVAVGLGLLLAYGLQHEIHRAAEETGSEGDRLNHLMELDSASTAYLVLSSVALAAFVKAEANAHSRNEWVPLLWGAAALLHLGRGRALRQAQWLNLGHGLLGLGLVHILAMNLGLDDLRYGVSLRLWTCLPFLGMLLVPYAAWARLHENLAEAGSDFLRNNYLYAAQAVLAGTLLFELERPWVVAAWCLQALVTLLFGVGRNSVPWLRAASLLALVATLRAFTINFAHWGYGSTVGERMVVIPLASAALLAGYIRLRLWNPTAEEDDAETRNQALREGRHRLPWFVMQAALLMAYIWVEASGKSLTVWATLYGFGTVGLGFLYRERLARLLGLGVLSACTLKLFLWDLRGLHGLARVGSFIVLGIVLISVSYVYTRFKERLEHLL
jgi:hypothetical protein